jgi:hypothetical protein
MSRVGAREVNARTPRCKKTKGKTARACGGLDENYQFEDERQR